MHRTNVTATLLASTLTAAITLTAASDAHAAANACQSEWIKFKSFFDQNGPKIARGICQLFNKNDAAAAQKCVDDFTKNKAKVDEQITQYNATADDGPGKIGPRGLGEGRWASGTLLAERTFAGAPVMSDTYRLELQRTGGKANKAMRGTVCFLDSEGASVLAPVSFEIDEKRTSFDRTFGGVAGLTPVILLEKPMGLNGHKYQIRGTSGGEPAIVGEARKVLGR